MKKKQSRLIIIVVLIAAGLLGVAAIITAIIYSRLDDVDPDPVQADRDLNKCEVLYVKRMGPNNELVTLNQAVDTIQFGEPIIIGSRFQTPKSNGSIKASSVDFRRIEYTINGDTQNPVKIATDDPEQAGRESNADFEFIITEFLFDEDDYEALSDSDTLQINVEPYGYPFKQDPNTDNQLSTLERLSSVGSCLPITFVLDKDPIPIACIEAGETGMTPTPIACPPGPDGVVPIRCDEIQVSVRTPDCCAGLVRVDNCGEPDNNNQCSTPVEGCFICLTDITDGICSEEEGENSCNSPTDCMSIGDPSDQDDDDDDDEQDDNQQEEEEEEQNDPLACQATCVIGGPSNQCQSGLVCQTVGGQPRCVRADCPSDSDCVCDPSEPNVDTSNFTLSKSGPACVERVAPNNKADFRITIVNSDDGFQEVLQIKDKLPLGFTFVTGSAKVDGVADSSDSLVNITVVGETQEIVWSKEGGWSIAPNQQLVIEFSTVAGNGALSGDTMNEVVITPKNNPLNSATLRTSFSFKVDQSCTTPQTGILDDVPTKIFVGFGAIVVAAIFYFTSTGSRVAENLHSSAGYRKGSSLYDSMRLVYLRVTEPRKYFEEKFEKSEKKRKKR